MKRILAVFLILWVACASGVSLSQVEPRPKDIVIRNVSWDEKTDKIIIRAELNYNQELVGGEWQYQTIVVETAFKRPVTLKGVKSTLEQIYERLKVKADKRKEVEVDFKKFEGQGWNVGD